MPDTPQKRSRNDSVLNTGMTSAAERKIREKQLEMHEKRQEKSRLFTVGGEAILEWIDDYRKAVIEDLAKLPFSVDTTEENVKSELRAFQMQLNFLTEFKRKARTQLRISERSDKDAAKKWLETIKEGDDNVA
jgi:hypothetical protein